VKARHNYYQGRAGADLIPGLDYFTSLLAHVFNATKDEALAHASREPLQEPEALQRLDQRARRVLSLFSRQEEISTREIAAVLALSQRMARVLAERWVKEGWLVIARKAHRTRAFTLSAVYRHYIGNLSALSRGGSEAFRRGVLKGEMKGRMERNMEVARAMKELGIDRAIITKTTGLKDEDIE